MEAKNRSQYADKHVLNLKAVIALNHATNLSNWRAAAIFRKYGLTLMQFAVLEVLYHLGDLTVGEIIKKIMTTGGNMTVVLKNLAKEGLISKKAALYDNRVAIISLTQQGAEKIEQLFPEYLEDLDDFLKCLSSDEKKMLTTTLRTLQKSGNHENTTN